MNEHKKVLLYSGGMDSWLIDKISKPDIKLFFDLGTPSSNAEKTRLSSDVVIDETMNGLGKLEKEGSFIVPLRNMFLIARAAEYGDYIILGTNKTDAHNDKTLEFASKMENILNYYYGPSKDGLTEIKDIKVDFSYKAYSRAELCKLYLTNGGSVEEAIKNSFSCYTPIFNKDGIATECHNCKPCFNKMMGFFVNGVKFPKGYMHSFLPYLKKHMKEMEKDGKWLHRYYTKKQFEDAIKVAEKDI